jgi:hypothetical protein
MFVIPGALTICRLEPTADLPRWATEGPFFSITRTAEELSIVLPPDRVPTGVRAEGIWRAFKVDGPIPFSAAGVLASIAQPLARAGITLFAISTFDTDYVLVQAERLEAARLTLVGAGHTVS